ncbi:type II toxin-antitoxin system HicB family antitoxin [Bosea sp. 2KB_26]|uniref:type II toxin-antitoxin system HicB family antitoxin n=1 Tax=Bosea sp. 2KB_26 TaxID=3237475 RepID=UPI003F930227
MPLAYALIHEENGNYGISFPDFPGCISGGATAEDAIRKGSEALTFHVSGMAEDGDPLPLLRSISELKSDREFAEASADAVVAMVPFDLPSRAVRINVSIDENLLSSIDAAAKAAGMTRSAFLAEAARTKIRAA